MTQESLAAELIESRDQPRDASSDGVFVLCGSLILGLSRRRICRSESLRIGTVSSRMQRKSTWPPGDAFGKRTQGVLPTRSADAQRAMDSRFAAARWKWVPVA